MQGHATQIHAAQLSACLWFAAALGRRGLGTALLLQFRRAVYSTQWGWVR